MKIAGLGAAALPLSCATPLQSAGSKPLVIATWRNTKAVEAAWNSLNETGNALDAVEQGARVPEADPNDRSVGYGGYPDRSGKMSLDACIMDGQGNCGSVAAVDGINHPITLARIVMEKTPHLMIVGDGAQELALQHGFEVEDLLSPDSKREYEEWLAKNEEYKPFHNPGEQHDTIGILAIDASNRIAGACSTSGMAYKLPGRVGDSPIIGAGLFVDDEVGAATATGNGEEMIRISGSHLIVERMRMGDSPQEACEVAIQRVIRKYGDAAKDIPVSFLAVGRDGRIGAWSTTPGFEYTVVTADKPIEVIRVGFAFE